MVREKWGPYSDPQHPYFYEEDDVWMAPGFINQFYEVPDYWKTYVHEVDEEREMWLNSFYKAPLRLPMPAELEYWWANYEEPEFVLINKDPEPDPEDPSKLIYSDDPLILHTPTGGIIDYVDDEEHGIRLFWVPPHKEKEEFDLDEVEFLPLGFDEFYGREVKVDKENFLKRLITSIENKLKPLFEKLEKWTEEKKKESEIKIDLLRTEIELRKAELSLKEAIEDTDEEIKRMLKEEKKKAALDLQKEEDTLLPKQVEEIDKTKAKDDEDEVEDEAVDEEDITASSFGSVEEPDLTRNDVKGKGTGKSPFAASSLSFTASSIVSMVSQLLQQSFSEGKKSKLKTAIPHSPLSASCFNNLPLGGQQTLSAIAFSHTSCKSFRLMGVRHRQAVVPITKLRPRNCPKQKAYTKVREHFEEQSFNILSLHSPIHIQ